MNLKEQIEEILKDETFHAGISTADKVRELLAERDWLRRELDELRQAVEDER